MPRRRVSRRIDARRPPGSGECSSLQTSGRPILRGMTPTGHPRLSACSCQCCCSSRRLRRQRNGRRSATCRRRAASTTASSSQRARHRLGDRCRARHRARALRAARASSAATTPTRSSNRELGAAGAEVRVGDRIARSSTPLLRVTIRHRPVPDLDCRRRRATSSTPTTRSAASRSRASAVARLEAPARRRAGLRAGEKTGASEQARAAARRLQLHDVEQRHVRLRGGHRSDLRVDAVLSRAARRPRARHLSRQHLPQQLRHRPHVARACWRSAPKAAS